MGLLLAPTIESLLAGDLDAASRAQGVAITDGFLTSLDDGFLRGQLRQARGPLTERDWIGRVMVRTADGVVVGHCGFHGHPDRVGRAEVGYTVLTPFRRRGYATEAVAGLIGWAAEQGHPVVVASIAPDNVASLAVVGALGFRQVGTEETAEGDQWLFSHDGAAPAATA